MQVNEKCDIFALGVMLWECMTGTRPFKGMHPLQMMHHVTARQRNGQDLLPFPQQCPEKVMAFIRKCWQADHSQRISAEEVHSSFCMKPNIHEASLVYFVQ
jgi:serine/threonine protein kinase